MHTRTVKTLESPAAEGREVTILPPGGGEAVWFLDGLVAVKASARTGARLGLIEQTLPTGSETPFHRHRGEDEAFYVLEGGLTLFLEGGRCVEADAGTFVHVPCGVAHGFRTAAPTRMLVLSDPDGFVAFVRDVGVTAARPALPPPRPPDVPRLVAAAARHGIELLGPLPG